MLPTPLAVERARNHQTSHPHVVAHHIESVNKTWTKKHQNKHTTVIGTFQTYTREERMSVEGMAGIVSLSKVFCSADHIVTTLREMTNEDVRIHTTWYEAFTDMELVFRRTLRRTWRESKSYASRERYCWTSNPFNSQNVYFFETGNRRGIYVRHKH